MASGPPPPGGDRDRNAVLTGVSWALASLAITFVTLRIYCRVFITRNMWWDDWAIILTMVSSRPSCASRTGTPHTANAILPFQIWSLTFTILWVVYADVGGTRHLYYLSAPTIESALRINWISQTFCVLGLAFGKVSVGFLIMRIGVPNVRTRYLLYFFMISQFIMFSLAIVFVWAQCTPVTKLWQVEASGKCWNPQILTDWTIICSSRSPFVSEPAGQASEVICRLQRVPGYRIGSHSSVCNLDATDANAQEDQPESDSECRHIVSLGPSTLNPYLLSKVHREPR